MKKRKGAAFLIVMILSALILLLAGALAIITEASYKSQALNVSGNKALTAAEEGISALTNPITPYNVTSFVATLPVIRADNQSFYWTKAVQVDSFQVFGKPNPLNSETYYIFDVYAIGVITNKLITSLSTDNLETLVENGWLTVNGEKITVNSERAIHLTIFEKESRDNGTFTFVPDTEDPPEISTDYLPRKSDWQEIDLATFLGN